MKLKKALALGTSLMILTATLAEAKNMRIYTGVSIMPLEVTGFTDAVLNDNHNYPSNTGATYLNLDQGNVSGSSAGVMLGFQYDLSVNHAFILEYAAVTSGDVQGSTAAIGYKYTKPVSKKLSIGIIPKFGTAKITTDLGSLVKYGTMPIITDNNTFKEGDAMESTVEGTIASIEVEAEYSFTEKILGFLRVGYQLTSFDKPTTTIDGKTVTDPLALDSGTLNNGVITYNSASNIDPFANVAANMDGLIMSLGVSYKF